MTDNIMNEEVTELSSLEIPYGKKVVIQNVAYDNGTAVLRMRIREGTRFTIFDLDANTATQISDVFASWSAGANS